MATNENLGTSPAAKAQCPTATRIRKVLAVVAFCYFGLCIGLMGLGGLIVLAARGPRVLAPLVRGIAGAILHLPLLCLVFLVALNALLTAEIVLELVRFQWDRARSWSNKGHLIAVALVWLVLFSGQLWFALAARQHFMAG